MAKSPQQMKSDMLASFKEKTGKSIEDWKLIVKASQCAKHGEIVKLLKEEHGLGHGYANMVALEFLAPAGGAPQGEDLVSAQYAGKKEPLRAIYDKIAAAVGKFGPDVVLDPKKTYVSLRRSKQFALVQPSTATRVDVGIQLKGEPVSARLEASGSFNAMVSHRVRLESAADVDKELIAWLKKAYEGA